MQSEFRNQTGYFGSNKGIIWIEVGLKSAYLHQDSGHLLHILYLQLQDPLCRLEKVFRIHQTYKNVAFCLCHHMERFSQLKQPVLLFDHLIQLLTMAPLLLLLILVSIAVVIIVPPVGSTQLVWLEIFECFKVEKKDFFFPLYLFLHIFVYEGLEESHTLVYCILRFLVEPDLV